LSTADFRTIANLENIVFKELYLRVTFFLKWEKSTISNFILIIDLYLMERQVLKQMDTKQRIAKGNLIPSAILKIY